MKGGSAPVCAPWYATYRTLHKFLNETAPSRRTNRVAERLLLTRTCRLYRIPALHIATQLFLKLTSIPCDFDKLGIGRGPTCRLRIRYLLRRVLENP